jgi:hypothetical protein
MSNETEIHTISLAPSRGMQEKRETKNNFTQLLKNFIKTTVNQRKIS